MKSTRKNYPNTIEDGVMPRGKCAIIGGSNEEVKAQLDRLDSRDRKTVADFRRLLRKMYEKRVRGGEKEGE